MKPLGAHGIIARVLIKLQIYQVLLTVGVNNMSHRHNLQLFFLNIGIHKIGNNLKVF